VDVRDETRWLGAKVTQHKRGLIVEIPGAVGARMNSASTLQGGVRQRRTDAIGIRVLVADDDDRL
jgi:hypothetical protein